MSYPLPHIAICVCTLKRPGLLRRLLLDLGKQDTRDCFTYSVVVADNDPTESAREVVQECASQVGCRITYVVEPRRSISLARNRSLEPAEGDYVAFIDDDEFPKSDWLLQHFFALTRLQVDGVFGPVRPHYDSGTPTWVKASGLYERPEHSTGFVMPWEECRTGNVLVKRSVLLRLQPVFRAEFGGGASDQDLFRRLQEHGHRFVWCNEAVVNEIVPPGRCKRAFLIRRALLRGGISVRHPKDRWLNLIKGLVAVPVYTLALPFLQLRGHHLFMRYLVKLFDHLGRLLAMIGVRTVQVRDMQ